MNLPYDMHFNPISVANGTNPSWGGWWMHSQWNYRRCDRMINLDRWSWIQYTVYPRYLYMIVLWSLYVIPTDNDPLNFVFLSEKNVWYPSYWKKIEIQHDRIRRMVTSRVEPNIASLNHVNAQRHRSRIGADPRLQPASAMMLEWWCW